VKLFNLSHVYNIQSINLSTTEKEKAYLDAGDASMLPLPNDFDVLAFAPEFGCELDDDDEDEGTAVVVVVVVATAARADLVVDR
jgi:hypothetical protein